MDIAPTTNDQPGPSLLRTPAGGHADGSEGAGAGEWPNYEQSPAIAAVLRLLGDSTRLRLLFLLVAGERSVTELYTRLGTSQPTVSHHLAWLRASNLVVSRRQRKHTYYALGPAVVADGDCLIIGALRIALGGDARPSSPLRQRMRDATPRAEVAPACSSAPPESIDACPEVDAERTFCSRHFVPIL